MNEEKKKAHCENLKKVILVNAYWDKSSHIKIVLLTFLEMESILLAAK